MTSSAPAALPRRTACVEVERLADVDEHGDDLVEAVVLLEPGDGAGRVEPAGVGEDGGAIAAHLGCSFHQVLS